MRRSTARQWLRANRDDDVADMIDQIMGEWRESGNGQRRDWWAVLAGRADGSGCVVAGLPKVVSHGLVYDPERGPLVRRALEDMATGRYTKQDVLARATDAGLRTKKGLLVSPQSLGQMMRNPIYAGKVESQDYGVSTKGDFEPLIDEATFYRAQAVLDGGVVVAGPRQRNHPDFPLRGFVRCETCGRPLTGSWSKGRNGHYAYYHCQRQCRAVYLSRAVLEVAFADELARLQATPGDMRPITHRILYVWEQRRAETKERTAEKEKRVKSSSRSSIGSTRRSCSRSRSTARPTSANATGCARS